MEKICVISFSGRSGGNCASIAREIENFWLGKGVVSVFDFSTFEIAPCGRCSCECFKKRESCPYFSDSEFDICDTITNSGLTYFVVPNYCDYPCANFFIFNERPQCYFQRRHELLERYLSIKKKFIVVSNTGRNNFTAAFRDHVQDGYEPDVLFLAAKKFGRVSIHGNLMDSDRAQEAVRKFIVPQCQIQTEP